MNNTPDFFDRMFKNAVLIMLAQNGEVCLSALTSDERRAALALVAEGQLVRHGADHVRAA